MTALAVQQSRLGLVVVSNGPLSPLENRRPGRDARARRAKPEQARRSSWRPDHLAVDRAVGPHGSGWASGFGLSQRSKPGGPPVSHQLGQTAAVVAPLPPGPPARREAVSVGPLLSMPVFFLRRSGTIDSELIGIFPSNRPDFLLSKFKAMF